MSGFPIHRGNLIISANNNSRWDFWANNETQRFVLAEPLNDVVPIAIRESNNEHFSYEHVINRDLQEYLSLRRHRIVKDYSLPGVDRDKEQNLFKLWKVPNLIEETLDNSLKLKEGMFLLLVFNSHGDIKEIAIPETIGQVQDTFEHLFAFEINPKVKLSYAMLRVESNELKVFASENMPIEFYSHLESFNDLINVQEILEPIDSKEIKL